MGGGKTKKREVFSESERPISELLQPRAIDAAIKRARDESKSFHTEDPAQRTRDNQRSAAARLITSAKIANAEKRQRAEEVAGIMEEVRDALQEEAGLDTVAEA